ncbi:hypothetical protein, partial [Klebsiella pneumoniae]|uniref:hypothetical protein n=1 Tax=Klebsiella pneumoniae TaxID=573 RepID=UPI003B98515B
EKSLPNVHLVGDKPAAAAPKPTEVAAPASTPAKPAAEHKDIFDRITGAVLDPKGTTKAITDTYHQWTSGKMSSGEKVAALGTAALV